LKKPKIYILLPTNISFSVFEATKLHGDLFKTADRDVIYLSRNKELARNDINYFSNLFTLINYFRKEDEGIIYGITVFEVLAGYVATLFNRKIKTFFWVQGLIDEEDYFSRKSKMRFYIFKLLMIVCLRLSSKLVVVTEYMFKILVDNYGCNPNKEYLILNCKSRVHYNGSTKIPNSLCYIGGLSKWQNVDKSLQFFNELCKENEQFSFYIATFDHEELRRLINLHIDEIFKKNIHLVKVKESEDVEKFLSQMQYGFLIRDNLLLNNVASPIKLAEYLACGVNPIMSPCLIDFKNTIIQKEAGIILADTFIDSIKDLKRHNHSSQKALLAYKASFDLLIHDKKLNIFLTV